VVLEAELEGARRALGVDPGALQPMLEIADSVITYRRRYFAQPQWAPTLDLLLVEESNPRSLAFQLKALADHVANLPNDGGRSHNLGNIEAMISSLNSADFPALMELQRSGRDEALSKLLMSITGQLHNLSDAFTQQYFTHAAAQVS